MSRIRRLPRQHHLFEISLCLKVVTNVVSAQYIQESGSTTDQSLGFSLNNICNGSQSLCCGSLVCELKIAIDAMMILPMRSKTNQRSEMKMTRTHLCNYDSPNPMEARSTNNGKNHLSSKLRIHCNALRLQQSRTHCLKQLFLVIAEH